MRKTVVLGGFVATLGFSLGLAYVSLPAIAEWAALKALERAGYPEARLSLRHIGFTRLEAADIDLGPGADVSVRRVSIDYSPARLVDGIIDEVKLDSPEMSLGLSAGGVNFGSLAPLAEAGGGEPILRVLGPVWISDGRLSLSTPLGAVTAALDGEVLFTDGLGTTADVRVGIDHPQARTAGRITGVFDAAGGVNLSININDGESSAEPVAFTGIDGSLQVRGQLPLSLDGTAKLSLQGVRLGSFSLGEVDLTGALDQGAATLDLIVGGGETGVTAELRARTVDVFNPEAPLTVAGDLATDGLTGPLKLPGGIDVIGALAFEFAGRRNDMRSLLVAAEQGEVRADGPLTGVLLADHLGVADPGSGMDATVDGGLAVFVGTRGIRVRVPDALDIDVGLFEGHRMQGRLLSKGDAPVIAAGPVWTAPMRLAFGFDGDVDGGYRLEGEAGGTFHPASEGRTALESFVVRFQPFTLRGVGLSLVATDVGATLSGTFATLAADVHAETRFDGQMTDGVELAGGRARLRAEVRRSPRGLSVSLPTCIELGFDSLRLANVGLRPGPIDVCGAEERPFASVVVSPDGAARVDIDAQVKSTQAIVEGLMSAPVSGTLPSLKGRGSLDLGHGTWWASLTTSDGDLVAEGPEILVRDVLAQIDLQGKNQLLGLKAVLGGVTLADTHRPERFTPILVTGAGDLIGERATFDGELALQAGPPLSVVVRHNKGSGRGHAEVRLPKWLIPPDAEQAETAAPILTGLVTDVSGTLSGEARFDWEWNEVTSKGSFQLADFGFATQIAELAGLSGDIVFDDLIDVRTAGDQRLTVGFLDAGLPLIDGKVDFRIEEGNVLKIAQASWPVAGGHLAIRDVATPMDVLPERVVADIEKVDAHVLVALLDIADLEADGVLSGRIPVRITPTGAVIEDAHIRADAGAVRYRSAAAAATLRGSGESAELLARALEDFRFETLDLSLNGPLSGDITAEAKISGANPALYDGKRIELNLHLLGALRDLLQSASVVGNLPDTIRDRVQGPAGIP